MPQVPVDFRKVDVAIIGAGWAGLSAARQFKDSNIDFVVIEGRHEIGGRCRTVTLNDGVSAAELGAQWIHCATKKNPVYQVAVESGIKMAKSDFDSGVIYSCLHDNKDNKNNNHPQYRRVLNKEVEQKWKQLMEKGFLPYQAKHQDDDQDMSLRDCVSQYLSKKCKRASAEDKAWLEFFLDAEVALDYGASLEDLSLHWWDSDQDIDDGKNTFITHDVHGGYKGVLDHFAKPIQDKILLNSKVTCIDWSESGDQCVSIHYTTKAMDENRHQMERECLVVARQVLLTVPLGVLKAKTIQFIPDLPEHKQTIISKMGMGLLNKCLLLWDDSDAACLPWLQNKEEWIERVVPVPTTSSHEQHQGRCWAHFFNPYLFTGRPMLCAWTAGRVAAQIEESLTDQEIQNQVLEALRSLFPTTTIPMPRQVVITRWGQDEFARGSYSYNAYGATHRYRDRLADPINDQLYFAGEACHAKFPSTTHGAFLSGAETAQRIVKDRKKVGLAT